MKVYFILILLLFATGAFGSFNNWYKWNYIGFPHSYASPTVSMYMADSPAANFEMGPFGRGPMVLYR
jgi:hypothetical protein